MIEIDKVSRLFQESMGLKTQDIIYIPQGENNWAFEIITAAGKFLFRVAKSKQDGLTEKLFAIEKLLSSANIPHAKLLNTRGFDSGWAPHGYLIFEFIDGQNGSEAILKENISFDEFHERLGALLKKIHSIEMPKFGPIPESPSRTNSDFLEHNIESTGEVLTLFENLEAKFPKDLHKQIKTSIVSIQDLSQKLKPVLTHTDPPPNNCILKENGEVVLIDWDNALGTIWVMDFADLTYSGSHLNSLGLREERREKIWKSFLKTHTTLEFSENELLRVERVCHILKTIYSLPYYYHTQNNKEWFWKTTDRLKGLLN